VRSILSDEKKLSIAELSHTLPDRLIEQTMLWSASSRWNCSLVYWASLVGVMQQQGGLAAPPDRRIRAQDDDAPGELKNAIGPRNASPVDPKTEFGPLWVLVV
jgi:hypothetical protein